MNDPVIEGDAAALRRQAFIDAATAAFFAEGYGGTTMSSIASRVGGSKTTLWSYFASKELLFAAAVDDIVRRHDAALSIEPSEDQDVAKILRRFGTSLLAMTLSEPILNLYRLVVAEAPRFPHLAGLFFERGPRKSTEQLASYLTRCMEEGALRPGDAATAARQFIALCHAGVYQRAIMHVERPDAAESARTDIEAAVDMFIMAWTVGPDAR